MICWKCPGIVPKETQAYRWLLLVNVILITGLGIFSAGSTMIGTNLIVGNLALQKQDAVWITNLYLLGINSTVPAATWIAGRFGYKKIFFIGTIIFLFSNLHLAIATNFLTLGIGRLIEGIGAGLIFPIGLAIIARNFPKEKLPLALNLYMGLGFGGGLAFATYTSGVLSQIYEWPSLFLFPIPICILSLILTWLIQEESEHTPRGKFDYWGFFFFVLSVSTLLIALTNGNLKSTTNGWFNPIIISCFIIGIISLILTIIIELHVEQPIIPLALFKDSIFTVGCLTLFALGMSLFASLMFLADYMEIGLGYDRYQTGLTCITYGVALGIFSVVADLLCKKIYIPLVIIMGMIILIYSFFLNNELTFQSARKDVIWIMCLRGIGMALSLGPVTARSMAHVPKALAGNASTLLTFFRQVGGTYGGAILGIVIIRRKIFHTARYGEQAQTELVGYKHFANKVQTYLQSDYSSSSYESALQTKYLIINNIKNQAYIQSLNDAFIFLAYITISITALIIILNTRNLIKMKKKKHVNK